MRPEVSAVLLLLLSDIPLKMPQPHRCPLRESFAFQLRVHSIFCIVEVVLVGAETRALHGSDVERVQDFAIGREQFKKPIRELEESSLLD